MTFSEESWELMLLDVSKRFGVTADFDFVLFLIGVQECGQGIRPYSREEKLDLINLARCTLLANKGYLKPLGSGCDGWPRFTELKNLKELSSSDFKGLLKKSAFEYLTGKL